MKSSASVLALFLANGSAHKLSKLSIHKDQLLDVGVRFATGMNGDEDLGQDITMKGEKFHYKQQQLAQGLPACDGSNGVVGLDCLSARGYPKKTDGRPYYPMNDAYPEGHPRYASRLQMSEDPPAEKAGSDDDAIAKEEPLPDCKAGQKPRVDMCKAVKQKFCKNNIMPNKVTEDEVIDCVLKPNCSENPGMAVGECYAPGTGSLLQIGQKHKHHHKHHHKAREDPPPERAGSDDDAIAKEEPLPDCKAGQKPRVDMCKAVKQKFCKNNIMPNKTTADEVIDCVLKPNCSENPGMAVGECYAPGTGSLAQQTIRHKVHHRSHHKHHAKDGDETSDRGSTSEEGEHAGTIPDCTGAKGENAGVDCKKVKKLPGCKRNELPTVGENEEAGCRVLPLCSGAGAGDCYAGPAPESLAQLRQSKEEEGALKYTNGNGFDLPPLPECTGMNGDRKVDCRQVGRWTHGKENWFVQTEAEGDDKKDEKPDYKKLTGGTPQIPECTGMNGDRKGPGTDCRQIGRYNGPWPVTDDVQLKHIGLLQTEETAQLPTCDQWITTNCQPVCTRDLTVGCTEERTPEPPKRDRFEGKWTHKPGQTTIQPRVLPRDGVNGVTITMNYHGA